MKTWLTTLNQNVLVPRGIGMASATPIPTTKGYVEHVGPPSPSVASQ